MERATVLPAGLKNLSLICYVLAFGLLGVPLARARVELRPCHNNISPQQQIELGQKAVQQVYQQMPVLPDSDRVSRYIQSLGQRLADQAPGYRWPYNFHVVNVADINAFALPGGSVFVNLGTIQATSNEAQLAAVMAHEISHVALQHSVCNLEKEKRVGLFAGTGTDRYRSAPRRLDHRSAGAEGHRTHRRPQLSAHVARRRAAGRPGRRGHSV